MYDTHQTAFCVCYREKVIRLQHENKMLKLKQAENEGENIQLLQTMLEDSNERKGELESQVRYVGMFYFMIGREGGAGGYTGRCLLQEKE